MSAALAAVRRELRRRRPLPMTRRRRYYVTGLCPLTGMLRDFFWAATTAEAREAFLQKHGIRALETEVDE